MTGEQMGRFALLFDESNTWLKQVLEQVTDLARQIRKVGGHVILAGHDWHASDIPRSLSAQFATRIAMSSTDDTAARVILNNDRWGKWTINKGVGRAVVRNQKVGYMPAQVYRITEKMQADWLSSVGLPAPLTEAEREIVERAMRETDGKISLSVLMGWGMGQGPARRLQEDWRMRGWAANDPQRDNSLYITEKLSDLVTNLQTLQTPTNPLQALQTGLQAPTNHNMTAYAAD
jgi:hypothetical protein